jgi:hypothetical protein
MDQEYQMKETNREFKRKRGFFTFAQNGTHDYVRMAYALALSLKATQTDVPYLSIGVTPGQVVPEKYKWAFDEIIEIPWGDAAKTSSWKLENEWKAYHMTPYEEHRSLVGYLGQAGCMYCHYCIDVPWGSCD